MLDFHGDDYAISLNNSNRFIELISSGKLDSFSIISNMGCYDECMNLLIEKWDSFEHRPAVSVHINLIDGFWLSKPGVKMNHSWGQLLVRSLMTFGNSPFKKELTAEIAAQISAVATKLGDRCELRIDSHVHTHMIPLVFDCTMDALDQLNISPEYIRVSKEPFLCFLTTKGVCGTFPVINLIKNIILRILSSRCVKILKRRNIPYGYLFGLNLSGKMDRDRVSLLLPFMEKYSSRHKVPVEVLCHPGIVLESEKREEYGPDDMSVFFSDLRNVEYDMIANRSQR